MARTFWNLHPQVCSLKNVMAAARFHARWESHAVGLHGELAVGTWAPGEYTAFDIHEPKLRHVAAAPSRDRVVHVLEPIFEKKFIEDSYACPKGKGTHARVRRRGS